MAGLPPITDVVVIGFGFAGAAASIAAADAGAHVLILEKAPQPGGISVCSAGGLRVADDADEAFAYLEATCGGKTPEPVLRQLAEGWCALPAEIETTGKGARRDRRASAKPAAIIPSPAPTRSASSPSRTCRASTRPISRMCAAPPPACSSSSSWPTPSPRAATASRSSPGARQPRLQHGRFGVDAVLLDDGELITARAGIILACGGFEADTDDAGAVLAGRPGAQRRLPPQHRRRHPHGAGARRRPLAHVALSRRLRLPLPRPVLPLRRARQTPARLAPRRRRRRAHDEPGSWSTGTAGAS